jgi:hypothetical protein
VAAVHQHGRAWRRADARRHVLFEDLDGPENGFVDERHECFVGLAVGQLLDSVAEQVSFSFLALMRRSISSRLMNGGFSVVFG